MDQRCGLERLAGCLLNQFLGSQLPQLLVDEWQQLFGGMRIALLNGAEDARNVVHGHEDNRSREVGQGIPHGQEIPIIPP